MTDNKKTFSVGLHSVKFQTADGQEIEIPKAGKFEIPSPANSEPESVCVPTMLGNMGVTLTFHGKASARLIRFLDPNSIENRFIRYVRSRRSNN
jgi:hypothetical protein